MRAIIQRVTKASVTVADQVVGAIDRGWLILLGVSKSDTTNDAAYVADRILGLRGFADADGKMNVSVKDIGGELLVVSQFTLYADCAQGRRPGFSAAAGADLANSLYQEVVTKLKESGLNVATGQFQAHMDVQLNNDGPVTFIIDSPLKQETK